MQMEWAPAGRSLSATRTFTNFHPHLHPARASSPSPSEPPLKSWVEGSAGGRPSGNPSEAVPGPRGTLAGPGISWQAELRQLPATRAPSQEPETPHLNLSHSACTLAPSSQPLALEPVLPPPGACAPLPALPPPGRPRHA